MRRVASSWAAFAALVAVAGCGDSRPAAAGIAAESGCAGCHSGPGEAPPFRDQLGQIDPSRPTVGAHDAHLHPNVRPPLDCAECHTKPRAVTDPGHLDESPGDLRFGALARTGGASPTFTREPTPTCSAVYCHGNFPGGNAQPTSPAPNNVDKRWVGGGTAAVCGSCHGVPGAPAPRAPDGRLTGRHGEHEGKVFEGESIVCATCHGELLPTHVNGIREVALPAWNAQFRFCAQACHQARTWDSLPP